MNSYVAELEPGVWIAPWSGDPGRTLLKTNAKVFNRKSGQGIHHTLPR